MKHDRICWSVLDISVRLKLCFLTPKRMGIVVGHFQFGGKLLRYSVFCLTFLLVNQVSVCVCLFVSDIAAWPSTL